MWLARLLLVLIIVLLVACGGSAGPSLALPPNDTPSNTAAAAALAPPAASTVGPGSFEAPPSRAPPRDLKEGSIHTEAGRLPSLLVDEPTAEGAPRSDLPLRATRASIRITPPVAEVEVVQRFENRRATPIDVVYVFPLPENAAVRGFSLRVGKRTISGRIDERRRARKTYDAAKGARLASALLEQERANVFVQSIANIPPNEAIEVTTRYVGELTYDAGVYELAFPLVVGPREATSSRVTPPYLGKGERSGADVSIDVVADKALVPGGFVAVTHDLTTVESSGAEWHAVLAKKDRIANRDFVLRFEASSKEPRATLVRSGEADGYFLLTVDPPRVDVDRAVGEREIVFAVDVSGSMAGAPLALTKRALRLALERLRPVDTFDIVTFSQGTGRLFGSPQPASSDSIERAIAFVDQMQAGGGTYVQDAIAAALEGPGPGKRRDVVFFTDGYVSADDLIVKKTRELVTSTAERGERAKVFGVGVGAAPNRSLIESLSREGNGAPAYLLTREDPSRAVQSLFRHIDSTVIRDITFDWGGLHVSDVTPGRHLDLVASRPLVVFGRFSGRASRPAVLRATSPSGPIEIPITTVGAAASGPLLGSLWARARLGELEADYAAGDRRSRLAMTRLALEFGLVTRFTSFVAFDREGAPADGPAELILQPAEAPEGLSLGLRVPSEEEEPKEPQADAGGATQDDERTVAASPPAEVERTSRGCFCHAAESERGLGWLAFVALSGAAALRRSRRRGLSRGGDGTR
jgi:Ca-activated chloride channel family protein